MTIRSHEETCQSMIDMAQLALSFGRINRTGVCHPDGTPETDAEHTIMLCWLAPALAEIIDDRLNPSYVMEMAAVHDAVEVYAGDTPTIRITDEELVDKHNREYLAARKLVSQFMMSLPRFADLVRVYEEQRVPEARFVRALDKLMPKLVHLIDNCMGARREGITRLEFRDMASKQRRDMAMYAGEWPDLFILHLTLCDKVLALPAWDDPRPKGVMAHYLHNNPNGTWMVEHHGCDHPDTITCPFTVAAMTWWACQANLRSSMVGVFTMNLDSWGELRLAIR
jgi:5'-deoxynucleotidase YfbR-like HD superfamily hydrolase